MWVVREQTGVSFNKPTSELNRLKKFGVRRNWCDVLTSVHDLFTSNHTCAVKGHQTMTLHQQVLPLASSWRGRLLALSVASLLCNNMSGVGAQRTSISPTDLW